MYWRTWWVIWWVILCTHNSSEPADSSQYEKSSTQYHSHYQQQQQHSILTASVVVCTVILCSDQWVMYYVTEQMLLCDPLDSAKTQFWLKMHYYSTNTMYIDVIVSCWVHWESYSSSLGTSPSLSWPPLRPRSHVQPMVGDSALH